MFQQAPFTHAQLQVVGTQLRREAAQLPHGLYAVWAYRDEHGRLGLRDRRDFGVAEPPHFVVRIGFNPERGLSIPTGCNVRLGFIKVSDKGVQEVILGYH